LRYKFKIKRKYFQHSIRDVADGCIKDNFFELAQNCNSFFIYYSFGSEADTHGIIDELLAMGKKLYLPRVDGDQMVAVEYSGGELIKSKMGIEEPVGQPYLGDFDMIIVPLLAINPDGYRLGYGGGFYDKFLKDRQCLKVGLGYSLQLTDEFKEDKWDVPLDKFICEKGVYNFEK
jgi:5-formyltetrahydrofolate cyclo-ligase